MMHFVNAIDNQVGRSALTSCELLYSSVTDTFRRRPACLSFVGLSVFEGLFAFGKVPPKQLQGGRPLRYCSTAVRVLWRLVVAPKELSRRQCRACSKRSCSRTTRRRVRLS
jgi:hypothetical protein